MTLIYTRPSHLHALPQKTSHTHTHRRTLSLFHTSTPSLLHPLTNLPCPNPSFTSSLASLSYGTPSPPPPEPLLTGRVAAVPCRHTVVSSSSSPPSSCRRTKEKILILPCLYLKSTDNNPSTSIDPHLDAPARVLQETFFHILSRRLSRSSHGRLSSATPQTDFLSGDGPSAITFKDYIVRCWNTAEYVQSQ